MAFIFENHCALCLKSENRKAPPVGLEPTTLRLTAACSTDWAKEEYEKEAPTRFELVIEVLQTFALPLGYGAI